MFGNVEVARTAAVISALLTVGGWVDSTGEDAVGFTEAVSGSEVVPIEIEDVGAADFGEKAWVGEVL